MNATPLILLLGSNLGESDKVLKNAMLSLEHHFGKIELASSVFRTQAWGEINQPDFLNQVVVIPYSGTAHQALKIALDIESKMGRIRSKKWGPRIIDIDLLYLGTQILRTEHLTLPHAALHIRRFTLIPLVEILPDFIHPVFNKTHQQLLAECPDGFEVTKLQA